MLDQIKDRYQFRIEREIAKGGMGSVYEATQLGAEGFEKRVALKALLPALSRNEKFIEMFIGEAKLVADLVHENIVQIYQLSHTRQGYYFVMEYVHGLPLQEFVRFHAKTRARIPVALAVFITSRIARGLAYAHSRRDADGNPLNIVHRDVCPNNILITTEGLPKLTDFGIARAANNIMPLNDRTLMGKMLYMSPEQAQRIPVDHRADIYALGMVLFELLALRQARLKRSKDALAAAKEGWIDWKALPGDVPPDLLRILREMLAADREQRYDDTSRLGYDLEYYIYRDGYGPTVVTLENYLRENFRYLFGTGSPPPKTVGDGLAKTVQIETQAL